MKTAIQAFEPAYRPVFAPPANDRTALRVVERRRVKPLRLTAPAVESALFHAWRP